MFDLNPALLLIILVVAVIVAILLIRRVVKNRSDGPGPGGFSGGPGRPGSSKR